MRLIFASDPVKIDLEDDNTTVVYPLRSHRTMRVPYPFAFGAKEWVWTPFSEVLEVKFSLQHAAVIDLPCLYLRSNIPTLVFVPLHGYDPRLPPSPN